MYEAFYGFKEKPFSMLPDPGFLYLSKKHQTALTLLEYGLFNKVGFCVISGDPGAGKTTILRAMLERVSSDVTVGLITNTHQSFGGLLDWILSAFDLHAPALTKVEMHQVFMEYLIDEYSKNHSVLLIVDEAQNMNADSLEELRMLSNVNSKKDQLLQIVLVGQPALKDILRKPELMQFAQRIAVDYHLAPLDLGETCGYIQHRLIVAGAKKDVFTPAACERIFNYSGGTPRLINLLCETVLVFGFADQVEMIDADLVEEMVRERMKDSVVPFINKDVANPLDAAETEKLEEHFPWISRGGVQSDDAEELQADGGDTSDDVNEEAVSSTDVIVDDADSVDASTVKENTVKDEVEQLAVEESGLVDKESQESPADDVAVAMANETITGEAIRPATAPATKTADSKETAGSPLVKYGVAALVLVVIVIILAVVFNKGDSTTSEVSDSALLEQQEAEAEQKKIADEKRIQEAAEKLAIKYAAAKEKLEKEQAKIENLKQDKINKEQAAIVAKENKAKQKKAKEKKAREQKAKKKRAEEKRAEEKRVEEKRKAQEAQYAEEREKRKAAQLEEAKRIKAEEEARQMERKYLKAEREREAKAASEAKSASTSANQNSGSAAGESATDGWSDGKSVPKKNNNAGCTGPTARFKSSCR